MLSTNDALSTAYQSLVAAVRDFHIHGRPCLGATLKPALISRGAFNEQVLGFRKFGDFLRAAAAAGHVQIGSTPGGDISVALADVNIPEVPPRLQTGVEHPRVSSDSGQLPLPFTSAIRVRQDLWNAFNSTSPNWVYDPARDLAYRNSDAGTAASPAASLNANLVQIPAGGDRVLEWMRSFANMQDPDINSFLSTAFEADGAPYRFANLVRVRGLQRHWGRFHVERVLSAIQEWASSNGVHPKNVAEPLYRPTHLSEPPVEIVRSPSTQFSAVTKSTPHYNSGALTGRLESLIDDLIDELLKLRGLLQIIPPKQS